MANEEFVQLESAPEKLQNVFELQTHLLDDLLALSRVEAGLVTS